MQMKMQANQILRYNIGFGITHLGRASKGQPHVKKFVNKIRRQH